MRDKQKLGLLFYRGNHGFAGIGVYKHLTQTDTHPGYFYELVFVENIVFITRVAVGGTRYIQLCIHESGLAPPRNRAESNTNFCGCGDYDTLCFFFLFLYNTFILMSDAIAS